MKAQKHQLFFWIGLILFALSLAVFVAGIIWLHYEYEAILETINPDDYALFDFGYTIEVFAYVFNGISALAVEFSCIRSVYRILKYTPHGATRICWLIAAILSFFALVLMVLMFTGVLNFTKESGSRKVQDAILLLAGWPVAIISFVLCNIRNNRTIDVTQ